MSEHRIRYECPKCFMGGAGPPDQKYICHRCGHRYMIPYMMAYPHSKRATEPDLDTTKLKYDGDEFEEHF